MLWIIKACVHEVLVFFVFALFRKEMRDGKEALIQKVEQYKPLIVCFNGKGDFSLLFCSCHLSFVSIDLFVFLLFLRLGQLIYNHCLSCSSLNLKISFLVWGWVIELEVAHRLCQDRDMLIKPQVNSDHMAAQPDQWYWDKIHEGEMSQPSSRNQHLAFCYSI